MTGSKSYFLFNESWFETSQFNTIVPENVNRIYEVLRVVNGETVFYEEHFARFVKSVQELDIRINIDSKLFKNNIDELILKNNTSTGNLRFELVLEEGEISRAIYLVPFSYPTEKQYANGICLASFQIERKNPHIKQSVVNNLIRSRINTIIDKEKVFEVLLVDHLNNITEGSRTNIFFIKSNILYTPPPEQILKGITRQKVIMLAKRLNIKVKEEKISLSEIRKFQACFITGTSPKILPVSRINNTVFDVKNTLERKLMREYDQLINL